KHGIVPLVPGPAVLRNSAFGGPTGSRSRQCDWNDKEVGYETQVDYAGGCDGALHYAAKRQGECRCAGRCDDWLQGGWTGAVGAWRVLGGPAVRRRSNFHGDGRHERARQRGTFGEM